MMNSGYQWYMRTMLALIAGTMFALGWLIAELLKK
jgi:hypothetical protein